MMETKEGLLRFEDNADRLYIITLSHLLQVERLKSGDGGNQVLTFSYHGHLSQDQKSLDGYRRQYSGGHN
ncbi:hypothetical protein QYF36_018472 [Acer negundo]|nr:hypothetical protein QYF36_018472 [Acer negundo]